MQPKVGKRVLKSSEEGRGPGSWRQAGQQTRCGPGCRCSKILCAGTLDGMPTIVVAVGVDEFVFVAQVGRLRAC